MRHISDHYLDYGCFRKGSTDDNETLQKETKKAYRSTNKQLSKIAPQLLSARAIIETNKDDVNCSHSRSQLLLSLRPVVVVDKSISAPSTAAEAVDSADRVSEVSRLVFLMEQDMEDAESAEDAERAILESLHPSTNVPT